MNALENKQITARRLNLQSRCKNAPLDIKKQSEASIRMEKVESCL